jgi:hypothetical protein
MIKDAAMTKQAWSKFLNRGTAEKGQGMLQAHPRSSRIRSPFDRTVKYVILIVALWVFLSAPLSVSAQSVETVADNWADQVAEKSSEDILSKIEKKVPVERKFRDAAKGVVKGLIKDELKDRITPKATSLAMASIVGAIQKKMHTDSKWRRGSVCNWAAANVAYNALAERRVVTGAGETFVGIAEDVLGGGKFRKGLGSLWKKLADNIRKKFESELDKYLKDYSVEGYAKSYSWKGCSVEIRVIWLKKTSEIKYLIIGDCNCNPVPTGKGDEFCLSRFSIVGNGEARWIGADAERANDEDAEDHSSLVGRVRIFKPKPNAECCNKRTGKIYRNAKDPWDLSSVQNAPSMTGGNRPKPKPKPEIIRVQDNRSTNLDAKGNLPDLPKGPVCKEEKKALLDTASKLLAVANEFASIAKESAEVMRLDQEDDPRITDQQVEAAGKRYEVAEAKRKAAQKYYDAVKKLKVKDCGEKHSSVAPSPAEDGKTPGKSSRLVTSDGLVAVQDNRTQYLVLSPTLKERAASDDTAAATDPVKGNLEDCAIAFSDEMAQLLKTTKLEMAHGTSEYSCPGLSHGWAPDLAAHCKIFEKAGDGMFTSNLAWQGSSPMCRIEVMGRVNQRPLRLDAACALEFEQKTGAKIQGRLVANGLAFRWQGQKLDCFLVTRQSVQCYRDYLANGVYPAGCRALFRREKDDVADRSMDNSDN